MTVRGEGDACEGVLSTTTPRQFPGKRHGDDYAGRGLLLDDQKIRIGLDDFHK